ncbi:MAG: dihydropteroate synthase [Rhodobacterales bacterium CG2_30_65_12]|nr:MAG: dihydropteroate synthase [Rhodobacterales bacterium CG2_30_65_12]
MTLRHRPIPRLGAQSGGHGGSLSLAGSKIAWFNTVERRSEDGAMKVISPAGLDGAGRARLSGARPDLCGLSLDRPRVMGIVNVTPDSFSDGGDYARAEVALGRAREMVAEGVDIIDIGGESTRPGAEEVPVAEEIARSVPVIAAIRAAGIATPISIDTRKAAVAEAALDAGANIVNDVAAFSFDPELAALCASRDVPVVLMHAQGLPADMQNNPAYGDVVAEVLGFLEGRIAYAVGQGVARERIITDPGIGFGKTQEHNLALLANLSSFHDLGLPVLLGASRKRFIGAIGNAPDAKDRLGGSLAVALHGAAQGVQIVRVHDTSATIQALRLFAALNGAGEGDG